MVQAPARAASWCLERVSVLTYSNLYASFTCQTYLTKISRTATMDSEDLPSLCSLPEELILLVADHLVPDTGAEWDLVEWDLEYASTSSSRWTLLT